MKKNDYTSEANELKELLENDVLNVAKGGSSWSWVQAYTDPQCTVLAESACRPGLYYIFEMGNLRDCDNCPPLF